MNISNRIYNMVRYAFAGLKQDSRAANTIAIYSRSTGGAFGGGKNITYAAATKEGYKRLIWVYRCINALGEAVGSVPWKSYRRLADGQITPLEDKYPLTQLLENPNPQDGRKEFLTKLMIHLSLAGNSYWEVVLVGGKPYQLFSVRPDWMSPIPDPTVYLKGYKLNTKQGQPDIFFEPHEILHLKYADPINEYVGMSPLQAAARTLVAENSAVSWNQTIFDNSAVPSGVLTVPSQLLKAESKQELREALRAEFTRENLNSPMILWGGMTWEKMGLSQRDMDFLEQRNLNKYEICGVFGVPPQIVGAQENPTYSNYGTARLSFWEDTVIGILDWLKGKINQRLAPYFGPDIFINYDLSSVPAMRKSFADTIDVADKLYRMGVPFNEINRRLNMGFNDLPWGDAWWAPATLIPVTGAPDATSLPKEDDINPYTTERL